MKRILAVFFLLVTLCIYGCGSQNNVSSTPSQAANTGQQVELTVAAAASLTDVTKDLTAKYNETSPNVKITFTYGASGSLQTQIEEGAPVDLFMSAGVKQMTALQDKNLLVSGTNKELLKNEVVLIAPLDSAADLVKFEDCAADKVKTIAMGDPGTVPAGQYAKEIFVKLNIWDAVNPKTNLGSDVRQVLTWVEAGEVDCGLVFKTDALTSNRVQIVATPPENANVTAVYPVGIIATSKNQEEAKKFEDFLFSGAAKVIFEQYGFTTAN